MLSLLVVAASLGCAGETRRPDGGGITDASGDASGADGALVDAGLRDASAADGSRTDGTSPDGGPGRINRVLALLGDPGATVSEVDELLRDVSWKEGWPLEEGGRWLFATRWDDAPGAVSLVSDINAWDPVRHAASVATTGIHYHVLVDRSDFAVVPEGAHYKWHASPDVFRPPPEATAYGFDAFGEYGWVRPPTDQYWLERFPAFRSAHLSLERALRFYLPRGFSAAAAGTTRTLLLHDGQNVFHPTAPFGGWHADETLAASFPDTLAAAVDNAADRMDAYTHVTDTISPGTTVGGRADDYIAMLRDEVLPFVRRRYGVSASGDSLMIAGSSLGGLVSLVIAAREPDLAGCVAALSPTLGWGAFASGPAPNALVNRWAADVGHGATAIYLDSGGNVTGACADGDGDGVFEDSDDSDNYCTTIQMRDLLSGQGYVFDTDLFHWWEPGASHNEAAWAGRLPRALAACETAGWR